MYTSSEVHTTAKSCSLGVMGWITYRSVLHTTVTNSIKFCGKGKPTFTLPFTGKFKPVSVNSSQMQIYDYRSSHIITVNDQAFI